MTRTKYRARPAQRTRIYPVHLKTWFPANDSYAATVARLCILREDLYLEFLGIVKPVKPLDANSRAWRRTYLLRNSTRTLMEIASALQALRSIKRFMHCLSKQSREWRTAFDKFSSELHNSHDFVKELRNNIGGHFKLSIIEKALSRMEESRRGKLELGDDPRNSHHQYTIELLLSCLHVDNSRRSSPDKSTEDVLNIPKVVAPLNAAIVIIDMILIVYAKERGFI